MAIWLSACCRLAAALQLLDLLADGARFLLGIPGAGDGDLLARHVVGAQRLAEPAFVVRDQVRGGGEDVAGRAVVALEPDHRGAGKVVLEAQDVVDLGAAPAVDRLVVVADAADVFAPVCSRVASPLAGADGSRSVLLPLPARGERVGVRGPLRSLRQREAPPHPPRFARRPLPARGERWNLHSPLAAALRQQPQPEILRHVGVLVFVDQDEAEARLILAQHFRLLAEQADVLQQEIAEIGGVEDFQPLLITPCRA